jgi:hypothetical protein
MIATLKRVGRPPRLDERRPVPTFFPSPLRDRVKEYSAAAQTPMSDWISAKCDTWLTGAGHTATMIYRTHPRRKDDSLWVPVQVILASNTYTQLDLFARRRDVSVASLVYTIVRWACDYN